MGASCGRQTKAFSTGDSCSLFPSGGTSAGKPRPKSNHLEVSPPEMELLGGSGHGRLPHDRASAEREAGRVPPWWASRSSSVAGRREGQV